MARTTSRHRCTPNRPCHTNRKVAAIFQQYYSGGGQGTPTVQASNFVLLSSTETTQTWKFTRGDGNGGCLVVMRANSPVNIIPTNGVGYYYDLNFGDGDDLGDSNYAVLVVEGRNTGGGGRIHCYRTD